MIEMFELGEDLVTTQGIVETGVAFPHDPPARWLARRPPGYSASGSAAPWQENCQRSARYHRLSVLL